MLQRMTGNALFAAYDALGQGKNKKAERGGPVLHNSRCGPLVYRTMRYVALFLLCACPLLGQSNSGELRVRVTDPSGLGVKSSVELVSEANQFRETLPTDAGGDLVIKRIPFGVYRIQIEHPGFAE